MPRVPITRVRTTHALTIKANGVDISLINGWNPKMGLTASHVFEVGTNNSGNPVEIVPGNINGMSVDVSRFDTYKKRMEVAFGTPDLVMLTRQNEPFDVIESWVVPGEDISYRSALSGIGSTNPFTSTERFIYSKCWFTNLGRTLRSDDNRIVNVSATLMFTKKMRVTGVAGDAATFSFLPL